MSAVDPAKQLGVLQTVRRALKPGGVLCFRDRALYDMSMLRGAVRVSERTYARADGTLAHYFSTDEVAALARAAGLEPVAALSYCTVSLRNRKTGKAMHRCFVHGTFRRPADEAPAVGGTVVGAAVAAAREQDWLKRAALAGIASGFTVVAIGLLLHSLLWRPFRRSPADLGLAALVWLKHLHH